MEKVAPPEFWIGDTTGLVKPHSYHTLRASQQRHTLTVISSPFCTRTGLARGMKRGNQLNMPSVCECGAMDIITSLYKTLSNVPAKPWTVQFKGA
jgi:hypothetical protein